MKITKLLSKNIPITIVAILGLLLAGFLLTKSNSNLGVTSFGGCVQGNFVSTDPFYKNGTFTCSLATGGAKELAFTISPDDAYKIFGVRTSKTVNLQGKLIKSQFVYSLLNTSDPVYSIGLDKDSWHCNVPDIFQCNDLRGAPWTKISNTGVSGCDYAIHNCNCAYGIGAKPTPGSCTAAYYQQIGRIYYIDQSSERYEYELQLSAIVDGQPYSVVLSDQNKSVLNTVFRAEEIQTVYSTSPPKLSVFLYTEGGANTLYYVRESQAQAVADMSYVAQNFNDAVSSGADYNSKVTAMRASAQLSPENFFGQYCKPTSTGASTLATTRISCTPARDPVINFNLYINADSVRTLAPSGKPQIIDVKAEKATAAQRLDVSVIFKNTAETAAFDVSLSCPKINPQVFTVRVTVDKDETKTVKVPTSYAGASAECLAEVMSVNSPQIKDSKTVTLTFYPFCTLSQKYSAQTLINTELGCVYVCPNYGEKDKEGNIIDVFDGSCEPITLAKYERCQGFNGTACQGGYSDYGAVKEYPNLHCTGVGTYLTVNQYLDQVNRKAVQPFVPEKKSHQYFIVSINDKPVCTYINEFGYKDGVSIQVDSFNYNQQYPTASQGTAPPPLTSPNDKPANVPPNTNPPPTTQPSEPDQTTNYLVLGAIGATIGGVLILNYLNSRKKSKR